MMRQPYELFTALRYLRARSKNGFISFISLVSMIGIGLAVAVLIVVLSVMNGFERELKQRILGVVSDAALIGYEAPLEDWRWLRERVLANKALPAQRGEQRRDGRLPKSQSAGAASHARFVESHTQANTDCPVSK